MKIKIGISARHVHLSKEDLDILFGCNYKLTVYKELNQTGEFASLETVSLKTIKDEIKEVRILGPLRNYTQVEISKTDSYKLGINPPVRNSGDLEDSSVVTIIGPKGFVEKDCCIIATRHIHMNKKDLEEFKLIPDQIVKVYVNTIKGGTMDNVYIKCNDNYQLEMHIDLDDANSHMLSNGDFGYIINNDN